MTVSEEEYAELQREFQKEKESRKQAERERDSLREELSSFKQDFNGYRKAVSKKFDTLQKEVQQAREAGSSTDNPEGEGSENDMRNALPIQQVTKIWKVGGTINANKTQHAAAIWSDFFDRADNGREVLYLPTDKVEQILKEHFRHDDRHLGVTTNIKRATIHRAMDALEDLAGTLVSSNIIKNGRRALMINQQEFRDFCDAIGATTDVTPDTATGVTRGS